MSRFVLLCLFFALACAPAGDTWAQTATPTVDAALNADRAKSNALTPEQRSQAQDLFKQAFDLSQAGDFEAARLGFEKGLAIDPANSNALFYLAETLLRQDGKDRALILYNKVIALDPKAAIALEAEVALKKLAALPVGEITAQPRDAKPLTADLERMLKPKDSFKECEQCPEMVVVPAGSFMMGSPKCESAPNLAP